MSKLAHSVGMGVGIGATLMLLSASAFAQDTAVVPPPPPGPPAVVPAQPPAPPPAPATANVSVTTAPMAPLGHDPNDYGAAGPPEPLPPVPADGLVKVHIATKELVTIEHRSRPEAPWQHGCETPCDVRLPAADEYRIVGNGVVDSKPFLLTAPKGDEVQIHVAPGIKSKAKVGEFLTFTGAVLFVGAVVVGAGAADPGSVFNPDGRTDNYNWNVIAVGTTVAVVGVVSGILGGAWWYDNSHTRVAGDVQEGGEQPVRGGLEPRYLTGMRTTVPNVQALTAPIFTASF